MPLPTLRQRQYNAACNAWLETEQNQLGTNLGGPVTPPGVLGIVQQQFDYDTPAIRPHSMRLQKPNEGWTWPPVDPMLTGQDTFYGAPGESVPTISQPYFARPPLLRTGWQFSEPLPLLGQDQFYGDPGESVPTISQPYFGRRPLHQHHQFIEPLVLLGADVFYGDPGQAITFGQSQPYFARPPLLKTGWQFSEPLVLLGQDVFYGDPGQAMRLEIAQPLIVRRPLLKLEEVFSEAASLNLLNAAPAETLPFLVYDVYLKRVLWVVPRNEVFNNGAFVNLLAVVSAAGARTRITLLRVGR